MLKKVGVLSILILISLLYCAALGSLFKTGSNAHVFGEEEKGSKVLILMYHSVLKDKRRASKYIVTTDELESDIEYLIKNKYSFLSARDIIDYTEVGTPLPDKSVMLTFDDGHYNFYTHVMPLLEKYDINAICSPVAAYTDEFTKSNIKNSNYGYLRWSEIYDMFLSTHVEVGNHSYNFHSYDKGRNGASKRKLENMATYELAFKEDTEKAQNRCMAETGFEPVIYTYPFGAYTKESTEYLKDMGFKMSLSCNEGINIITRDKNSLFLLKRFNRPGKMSSAEFFKKIQVE